MQHVFHTYLLGVAHRPYGVELQAFGNGTLQDEDRRGSRTGNQVHALRVQLRDGLAEDAVVPGVHKADAVGTYQRGIVPVHRFQNAVFQHSPLVRLLAEAGREDDEGFHPLFGGKHLHGIGTKCCGNGKYGKVGVGDVPHIGKGGNALHLCFLRVHGTKSSGISAVYQVSENGSSGLVYVVRRSHHHDAFRVK